MKILRFIFMLLIFGCFVSCKKEPPVDIVAEPPSPTDTLTQYDREMERQVIEGSIDLPDGSSLDVNSLTLNSPLAQAGIISGRYQITTIKNEFTTQIATDTKGDIILMGFCYPGQTNFTIDAQSTAIAMLMNTPAVYSLSREGKLKTIASLKNDPALTTVVQEIELLLRSSTPLLAEANTKLAEHLNSLFDKIAMGIMETAPVTIQRAGRNLIFQNSGVGHASVVGIYKDQGRQEELTVGPVHFVPTSLAELWQQVVGDVEPVEVPYTLSGDGIFDIKIRTGRPNKDDDSPEHKAAFNENLGMYCLQLLEGALPQLKYNRKTMCGINLTLAVYNKAKLLTGATSPSSAANFGYMLLGVANQLVDDLDNLHKCYEPTAEKGMAGIFSGKIKKLFGFFENALNKVSALGSAANISKSTWDWYTSVPAIDTCFKVNGNSVVPCCIEDPNKLQLLTGGSSKTWKIILWGTPGNLIPTETYCNGQLNAYVYKFSIDKKVDIARVDSRKCEYDYGWDVRTFKICDDYLGIDGYPGYSYFLREKKIRSITSSELVIDWVSFRGEVMGTDIFTPL